jgi:hypothetical protein
MFAVTLAASTCCASSLLAAQNLTPQYGRKPPADKGPRALGLVQLSSTGKKARFIPIAIMIDGKFYDAGSYKAAPVPMALDFGIVYEAFRTGVSQGVFTISQPGQMNHVWIAEGTWLPAGAIDPHKRKKYSTPVIAEDDRDSPPVLHRRAGSGDSESNSDSKDKDKDNDKDKSKNNDQPKPAATPASPTAAAPPASTSNSPASAKTPTPPDAAKTTAPPEAAKASAPVSGPVSAPDEPIEDPSRPRLRRGKPESAAHRDVYATFDAWPDAKPASGPAKADAQAAKDAATPQIVVFPAVSDAGGPDPRPYTYDLKPAEEASYRKQMLDLAATQLRLHASATPEAAATSKKPSSGKSGRKSDSKPPQSAFDDVSLRIFDLSTSNEPVLVLSAKTHPASAGAGGNVEEPKEITLIARTNLENELRKLFFSETDSHHLDMTPRMVLIDAVDADGDGRGELLFRRTFDDGSVYAIYRVTADGLWPLFEPTP